jgi:hypothetical protein
MDTILIYIYLFTHDFSERPVSTFSDRALGRSRWPRERHASRGAQPGQ